ncbi:unnamed protein product [Boreogadus saida]
MPTKTNGNAIGATSREITSRMHLECRMIGESSGLHDPPHCLSLIAGLTLPGYRYQANGAFEVQRTPPARVALVT